MATIIYGNMGDEDCKCLQTIWEGIDNVKVIEIRYASDVTREEINAAIAAEEELLICCGHGSSHGLFGLNKSLSSAFAFGEEQIELVKAKNFFGMWCHASDFAKYTGVKGFFTSMFISNPGEAACNGINGTTQEYVNEATIRFCKKVNELIRSGKDVELWKDELMPVMDKNNPVDVFNYNGLYMSHGEKFERPKYDFSPLFYGDNDFDSVRDVDIVSLCDYHLQDLDALKQEFERECKGRIEDILWNIRKEVRFEVGQSPYATIKYYDEEDGTDTEKEHRIESVWIGEAGDVFFKLSGFSEPFIYDDVVVNYSDLINCIIEASFNDTENF